MAAFLGNVPAILGQLPDLLLLTDILFYVFAIMFFGSIAVRGFRGHMHAIPHFGLRILMGVVSVMGGLGLQDFFTPFFGGGIYQLLNVDLFIGMLISSLILCLGLYLVSFRLVNIPSLKKQIEKMRKRIEKAKKVPRQKLGWRDPVKIVGIVIIVGLLVFSLSQFNELTRPSNSFLSAFGIDPDSIEDLSNQFAAPEGCESVITLLQETGPDITGLPEFTGEKVKGMVEAEAGSSVLIMRTATHDGKEYIIAVTKDSKICSATIEKVCGCIDTTQFGG